MQPLQLKKKSSKQPKIKLTLPSAQYNQYFLLPHSRLTTDATTPSTPMKRLNVFKSIEKEAELTRKLKVTLSRSKSSKSRGISLCASRKSFDQLFDPSIFSDSVRPSRTSSTLEEFKQVLKSSDSTCSDRHQPPQAPISTPPSSTLSHQNPGPNIQAYISTKPISLAVSKPVHIIPTKATLCQSSSSEQRASDFNAGFSKLSDLDSKNQTSLHQYMKEFPKTQNYASGTVSSNQFVLPQSDSHNPNSSFNQFPSSSMNKVRNIHKKDSCRVPGQAQHCDIVKQVYYGNSYSKKPSYEEAGNGSLNNQSLASSNCSSASSRKNRKPIFQSRRSSNVKTQSKMVEHKIDLKGDATNESIYLNQSAIQKLLNNS